MEATGSTVRIGDLIDLRGTHSLVNLESIPRASEYSRAQIPKFVGSERLSRPAPLSGLVACDALDKVAFVLRRAKPYHTS